VATPYDLPAFPIVDEGLTLCNDEDWLTFDVTGGGQNVALCAAFEHDLGDVDLILYDAGDGSEVASSLGKTDSESILVSLPDGTYDLRVLLDQRDTVNTNYELSARFGTSCP
jgi:hypothetical protein